MNLRRCFSCSHPRRTLTLTLLAGLLTLSGCMRMAVVPTADRGTYGPMSEPRPVDKLTVQLDKDPTQTYRIGPRDLIRVDVRKDPTLSQNYIVTEEGNILLPNIGAVQVSNMTAFEAEQRINRILAEYIREPEAKVGVQDYRSKVIFVVGQVMNPGIIPMRADMLTLQEAVFLAGLPTPQAALQRTQVITPSRANNPIVRRIDLADIIYRGRLRENILLRPGDIVYVPARYSVNLTAAIHDLLRPAQEPVDMYYRLKYNNDDDNDDNGNGDNVTVNTPPATPDSGGGTGQ